MTPHTPPELVSVPAKLLSTPDRFDKPFDALIVVAQAPVHGHAVLASVLGATFERALRADKALDKKGSRPPLVLHAPGLPGERLVVAPTASLEDDTADVRLIAEAVAAATNRAVEAGARKPLVWVVAPETKRFVLAREVAALAALGSQWASVEAREAGKAPPKAELIGVVDLLESRVPLIEAIEQGRTVCRDITGTEPERMAPRKIAELCTQTFASTGVKVDVEEDVSAYPLLAAVARASMSVERHRPCVVKLSYEPEKPVYTMILAGKGVTYDMGGADLKTDGHMAGMSRDKGGAGAVAGLVLAAARAKLPVRVIGLLGLVRNNIGDDAFVSDEIITSRAGVRVRIGNTDAEGRLVLADLLAAAKSLADEATPTLVVSIATLTGHVYRAFGPYAGIIGNGPAQRAGVMNAMDELGEMWAEPAERSRPRREDYAFVAAKSPAEDVVSSNRLASVNTPRGHQFPFAFMDIASGLRGGSLPWVHLDIGGVAVDPPDWQFGRPTGHPVAMLVNLLWQQGQTPT